MLDAVGQAAVTNQISILTGSVMERDHMYSDAALLFRPDGTMEEYDKRALWEWDRNDFVSGTGNGIVRIGPVKIGIRICFEVRFPEYFRELYKVRTLLYSHSSANQNPREAQCLYSFVLI